MFCLSAAIATFVPLSVEAVRCFIMFARVTHGSSHVMTLP